MTARSNDVIENLKSKNLALFFTAGISLKIWHDTGMIDREAAIYNKLSNHFKYIYIFTYGDNCDLECKSYLADNIIIVPKKYVSNSLIYSIVLPFIHRAILKDVEILKTNQMWGSWSAILTKLIYRKKLLVRTGYLLSISFEECNYSWEKWIMKSIEKVAYKFADGIITSSKTNYEYVGKNYKPLCPHILIPNYVQINVFKPMNIMKKKGSICFIGRLTKIKNIISLLSALKDLPYSLSIIGLGEQEEQLKNFSKSNEINANFLGSIPNHALPEILNTHELFILPSLSEGMPKTLLEAMACGLPVIGTNVRGINEVIEHGRNGILCDTDPNSIREAIITLMQDEELKQKFAENARKTIVENFSLENLAIKEISVMRALL